MFGSQACLGDFSIGWEKLLKLDGKCSSKCTHIPTLKIASVALLIICCFMAASGTGGSLSEEDSLQSCSTEQGQGDEEGASLGW